MSLSASRAYMPTHNQRLILDLVRTRGPISRADIVRLSNLTFPSVSRIVGELIERDLIAEKRQRRGGMGKPPTELELNPESAYSIGINLDNDCLTGVLVDLSGKVLAQTGTPLQDSSPKTVQPLMLATIDTLLGAQDVPQRLLLGLGASLPVPLHTDKVNVGTSASLDEFDEWQNLSLASALAQHVGCPVLLENNATAAAIAERWYGVGRDIHDFLFVFLAAGLGGGVILGGQPHLGYRGFGGELGSIPAYNPRPGEPRTLNHYAEPRLLLSRLREAQLGTSQAELEAHYEAGNELVMDWLSEVTNVLAPVLVSAEYLLDPEAIIFGGRLPANLTDGLIERLGLCLPEFRHTAKTYQPQLLRGATGEYAAALGAATIPIYQAMTPDPARLGLYHQANR